MIQYYENVQWRVVSYFETGIEFMGWERGIRLEDWNKMWNAIPNKKFPLYMCVYVCTEIFGKQQASVWKPFFLLGTMHGILLVLGRRSKNKRWGGSGLAFID